MNFLKALLWKLKKSYYKLIEQHNEEQITTEPTLSPLFPHIVKSIFGGEGVQITYDTISGEMRVEKDEFKKIYTKEVADKMMLDYAYCKKISLNFNKEYEENNSL